MSAPQKIPESLHEQVLVHHSQGWSLRRIATWLNEEHHVDVTRSAVQGLIDRSDHAEVEFLDDAWCELVEEAPTNLQKLGELQAEVEKAVVNIENKVLTGEDAVLIVKLLAQRERLLLWKLRTAGMRAPPKDAMTWYSPSPKSRPSLREPDRPPAPTIRQPPRPSPITRPAPAPTPVLRTKPAPATKPAWPDSARNAPCPCGSGQKYKKCHGGPNPPAVTVPVTNDLSQLSQRVASVPLSES